MVRIDRTVNKTMAMSMGWGRRRRGTRKRRGREGSTKGCFACTQDAETGGPEKFSVHGIPSRVANSREPASHEEHQRGYTSNVAAAGVKVQGSGWKITGIGCSYVMSIRSGDKGSSKKATTRRNACPSRNPTPSTTPPRPSKVPEASSPSSRRWRVQPGYRTRPLRLESGNCPAFPTACLLLKAWITITKYLGKNSQKNPNHRSPEYSEVFGSSNRCQKRDSRYAGD